MSTEIYSLLVQLCTDLHISIPWPHDADWLDTQLDWPSTMNHKNSLPIALFSFSNNQLIPCSIMIRCKVNESIGSHNCSQTHEKKNDMEKLKANVKIIGKLNRFKVIEWHEVCKWKSASRFDSQLKFALNSRSSKRLWRWRWVINVGIFSVQRLLTTG